MSHAAPGPNEHLPLPRPLLGQARWQDGMLRRVLVTGGAGFVGSTLVRRLRAAGAAVAVLDDCSRGHADSLPADVPLLRGDVVDPDAVRDALAMLGRPPDAVIHLAGWILVGESVHRPDDYLRINAGGTQVVAEACLEAGVPALVLASSAAVLAADQQGAERFDESARIGPESPYGESKWQSEQTLAATAQTGAMTTVALRLFNVAGAEPDCPERHDPESHLIPLALDACVGQRPPLRVFGTDLPTPDGTCVRDYIHVRDVVLALQRSAQWAVAQQATGEALHEVLHVGSGQGRSVREVLQAVHDVVGRPVPHTLEGRREGDVPVLVAESGKLRVALGVAPDGDLHALVRDAALSRGIALAG